MTAENQLADPFEGTRTWRKKFENKGWWHSFELPDGTKIDGVNGLDGQKRRIAQFPIPEDLRGKRVLDIGAWDGWFSFEMERRGADVLAIDNWDNPRFHEARRLLNSRVDYRQLDVYDLKPARIGRFDIVLFFGVLYHLKHPLLALERVCALTTSMAAVDSFILREEHMPGHGIEKLPVMAYYETDEFAGQTDNWVAPTLPCLLAFCRTAGFARVELQNVIEHGACIACYREWQQPVTNSLKGPVLVDVFHNNNGGINFEACRDTYLSAFFDWSENDLTRDDVQPEIGGFGVRPLDVWKFGEGRWQVDFKLPPGLAPGWQDVRVRIRGSYPSNALRIAVDLALACGPIQVAGVRDGVTWESNRISRGGSVSIWVAGLPENADRSNVRAFLGNAFIEVLYLAPAGSGEPRQLNARVPEEIPPGSAELRVKVGEQTSPAAEVQVTHE